MNSCPAAESLEQMLQVEQQLAVPFPLSEVGSFETVKGLCRKQFSGRCTHLQSVLCEVMALQADRWLIERNTDPFFAPTCALACSSAKKNRQCLPVAIAQGSVKESDAAFPAKRGANSGGKTWNLA
jgi:hypothetical protein